MQAISMCAPSGFRAKASFFCERSLQVPEVWKGMISSPMIGVSRLSGKRASVGYFWLECFQGIHNWFGAVMGAYGQYPVYGSNK